VIVRHAELQVAPLGGLVSCRAFGKRNQRFGQVPIKRFTTKLLPWRKPLEPDSGKIRPARPRNSTLSVRPAEQPSRAFWHNNRVIVVIRVSEGSNQGSAHHYTRQHTQQRLLSAFMEIRFQETNGPTWSAIYHYARADPAEIILYQIIFIHAVFSSGRFLLKLWPLRRHFYCSVIITHRIMGHYSNLLMVALGEGIMVIMWERFSTLRKRLCICGADRAHQKSVEEMCILVFPFPMVTCLYKNLPN
jgi:hypothetical protein